MPFGLRNASKKCQRFTNGIFSDVSYVFVYIDDILITSKDACQHEKHVEEVLQRLSQNDIKIKTSKCIFGVETIGLQRFKGMFTYCYRFIKDISKTIQPSSHDLVAYHNKHKKTLFSLPANVGDAINKLKSKAPTTPICQSDKPHEEEINGH